MTTPDDRLSESIARLEAPAYLGPVRDELDRLRTENAQYLDDYREAVASNGFGAAENMRLTAALEQAEARVDRLHGNLDMLRATLEEERAFLKQRSDALNRTGAINDTLRATIARIEKLAEKWQRSGSMNALSSAERWQQSGLLACARDATEVLAALADQEPAK